MSRKISVIVGLGATGISCAYYLERKGIPFAVMDTRLYPPYLTEFKKAFPNIPISLGEWDQLLLNQAERLVISPGISSRETVIAEQMKKGVPVIGDIELFAQEVTVPIISITGTNAKSTVTTLVGEMMKAAGKSVRVGGNIGVPALNLLLDPFPQVFVMELSSFQLETTHSLTSEVATILNITPDHMDRYRTLEAYRLAKQRVYSRCKIAVFNRDDPLTQCDPTLAQQLFSFTLHEPRDYEFGLLNQNDVFYLAFQNQRLLPVNELPILGRHYQANALAALAIGYGFGLPFEPMIQTLMEFKGLPHRCQLVREYKGVRWYNDSKGTNVGATLAAIEGLGPEISGRLILIAGGVGKNADFSLLVPAIEKYVKAVILIGEAAPLLAEVIGKRAAILFGKTMEDAVSLAKDAAISGDCVLLSPACASFDMFKNFEHRGIVFSECVKAL